MDRTSDWLCEYAIAQLGRPYWRGTYGQIANQALYNYEAGRFPNDYNKSDYFSQFGQKVHDCCGLVKASMMCDGVNEPPKAYIKKYDQNPEMLYKAARVRGSGMKTFPGIRGYLVYDYSLGHVGVYVGGGQVVEARGHSWGVVRTQLSKRPWDKWSDYWAVSYAEGGDEVKFSDIKEIRKGSTGEEVRVVQAVCMVTVDGIFGPNTDKAVKAFQKRKNLVQDGIVGEKTWKAIIEEWYK